MGTDKLTHFPSKSGNSEPGVAYIALESGVEQPLNPQNRVVRVAPPHDLQLTCQYLCEMMSLFNVLPVYR